MMSLYGVEAIVEILAEASLADRFSHIDICGSHDADIRLAHFLSTHSDVFARLEHSQQSRLGGYGQFTHLVEEDGTPVGDAKISLALTNSPGKRAFLMAEELAVDGSLGNASAVDGKIFLSSSWRIVVYYLWNDFLSHTAFSYDEHRKVGRCHLQGNIERTVQFVAIAHDIVP